MLKPASELPVLLAQCISNIHRATKLEMLLCRAFPKGTLNRESSQERCFTDYLSRCPTVRVDFEVLFGKEWWNTQFAGVKVELCNQHENLNSALSITFLWFMFLKRVVIYFGLSIFFGYRLETLNESCQSSYQTRNWRCSGDWFLCQSIMSHKHIVLSQKFFIEDMQCIMFSCRYRGCASFFAGEAIHFTGLCNWPRPLFFVDRL